MALRRSLRFAPLVLTGCTMLSGAASLGVAPDESELPQQEQPSAITEAGVPSRTMFDGAFSKDAYTKSAPLRDASDPNDPGDPPPPPPPPPPPDAGSTDASAGGGVDAGGPITLTFTKQLPEDAEQLYGPFAAKGGTTFDSRTTGTGDPDLFLRFGSPPTPTMDDCASDYDGPNERCRRTVPAGGSNVYLVVYAWAACNYTLTVTYTPAAP